MCSVVRLFHHGDASLQRLAKVVTLQRFDSMIYQPTVRGFEQKIIMASEVGIGGQG